MVTRIAEEQCADKCNEYAELCSCAEKERLRVSDQCGEVRHSADAEEDQRGINTELNAEIEEVKEIALLHDLLKIDRRTVFMDEEIHVVQVGARKVCKKHTERNGKKEQRFKLTYNRKIEQRTDDHIHDQGLDQKDRICKQFRQSGRIIEISKKCSQNNSLLSNFNMRGVNALT